MLIEKNCFKKKRNSGKGYIYYSSVTCDHKDHLGQRKRLIATDNLKGNSVNRCHKCCFKDLVHPLKGKQFPEEAKRKMIETKLKNPFKHSEKTKKILSEKATGRKMKASAYKKLLERMRGPNNHFLGRKLSSEHIAKLREGRKKYKITPEVREKIGMANRKSKHYAWNPNMTMEEREDRRFLRQYVWWSKEVKRRDNFQCKKCNSNKNLNSHHIYNYGDYYLLRYIITNGITLCKNCHQLFHSRYGKRYNNIYQIEEFLS